MNRLKHFIIAIILLPILQLSAQQTLEISFEGRHYEGEEVGLDSILIKNITRNCDTMLFAPDTSLVLLYYVGDNEIIIPENEFDLIQNYPNPMKNGKTYFDLVVSENTTVVFELFDLMGSSLLKINKDLMLGRHTYNLQIDMSGTFILRTHTGKRSKTIKIINQQNGGTGNISLEEHSLHSNFKEKLKPYNSTDGFWFEPGDTLWYAGYSTTPHGISGSDVLEGVPIINEHRYFSIVEGLPCKNSIAVKHGGYLYPTVQIAEQCWIKENMNIGEMINGDIDMTDNGIFEKYCYNNLPENCDVYGGLYQWGELMQYIEKKATQGICPNGWHIPTDIEFMPLIEDFDGEGCKERGNSHWEMGFNIEGDNIKGFTVLGSGYRQNTTDFEQLGTFALFHSSLKMPFGWVWHLGFSRNNLITFGTTLKVVGGSVRCIKD